jgi:hypothetical protein
VAGEGESPEVKANQAQLDETLGEIDRRKVRLAGLEKLVEEGSFSRSLFDALDGEKAGLGESTSRSEKLAAILAGERSKASALHAPEELLERLKSGNDPELRLRLKMEIKKRIAKIEVSFDMSHIDDPRDRLDYGVLIRFINGALRVIGVKDGKALAAKLRLDPEELRKLDKAKAEAERYFGDPS